MYPQYQHRPLTGVVAIWLLLTVGALLIPIIIIAICCIRRHWLRRPNVKLMENHALHMRMTSKRLEALRSYNGPYTESTNDYPLTKQNSLRSSNSHVHWSEEKIHDLNTTVLTESPSAHRRPPPPVPSSLSHLIQSAIIPAGSTISGNSANQFLTPSKQFTSTSFPYVNNH